MTKFVTKRNGEIIPGSVWCAKESAEMVMNVELEIELEELAQERPDSQFVVEEQCEGNRKVIHEYYYDEEKRKTVVIITTASPLIFAFFFSQTGL